MSLPLPEGWQAGTLVSRAQAHGVGLAPADAFAVGPAPQAVRIGLGAPRTRMDLKHGLEIVADLLSRPADASSLVV